MHFLYPTFLWALLAISIPILIHLFHFRRFKNVYFSNVKFLRELKEETSNRNKLRNLLVLISRILVISALVFAFAQPFIPVSEEVVKGRRAVSIYIDNSFSMSAMGSDIDLLSKAKVDAVRVINAYDNADQFQVLTNDFGLGQQRWLSKDEAIETIESVESSHSVKLLSQVLNRQKLVLSETASENQVIYWLSDFQKITADIDQTQLDSTIQYNVVYLSSVRDANISIDSCWWVAPLPVRGQQGSLIVRITNFDTQEIEDLTVNLSYNGQKYPLAKVSVPAQQSITDTLKFTLNKSGWSEAVVSIQDHPVRFDDNYYIAFEVSETIPVLIINEGGKNPYINAVFESSQIFDLDYFNARNIEYNALSKYKLIVLDDLQGFSSGMISAIKSYVEGGGNLLLFPGKSIETAEYNNLLSQMSARLIAGKEEIDMSVGKLNEDEFVFKDVFERVDANVSLPSAKMRYELIGTSTSQNKSLLTFRDGRSYIDVYSSGEGSFFFSSVPLGVEVNDLVKNAEVFVPMIYRMALSGNATDRIAYTIGMDKLIRVNRDFSDSEVPYKIRGQGEFIPGIRKVGPVVFLDVMDQIDQTGIFQIVHEEEIIKEIAFNYDRRESKLDCFTEEELENLIHPRGTIYQSSENDIDLTNSILEKEKGIILWKWFLILALIFIAVEVLLLRFVKI